MSDILKNLNLEQKEAVTSTKGPLLIIAGAGTGKTTVIARRIAYIIEKKLAKPAEILALTFTDKAASEMEERVDQLVPYGVVDTWVSTFHAFGDRILRENALDLGISSEFRVLSRPEQILFVQQNLFAFDLEYYRPLSNPAKFIDAILTLVSRAKDEDISPEDYQKYIKRIKDKGLRIKNKEEKEETKLEIERQQELADFYKKYEVLKTEAGLLDFGDQISLTLKLLKTRPKILRELQERFKYILVDEFQDSNYSQNKLVQKLAERHKNICVVGDDDQSIYKFRGAAISNILEFKRSYPKTKQVVLTTNYRSTQSILNSAYKLIVHNNPDRLEVRNKIDKKLISARKKRGIVPQLLYGATFSEETDLVAKEIDRLVRIENYKFRDIAILVRANSSAESFIHALNMLSIPSQFVGSFGLYDREEVKMLIAFLKALTTYQDDLNMYFLSISEIYEVPVEDLIMVNDLARRRSQSLHDIITSPILNQLTISEDAKGKFEKLTRDLTDFRKTSGKLEVGKLLYQYLQKTGYLKKLTRQDDPDSQEKISNIAKFFDRISEFGRIAKDESVQNFSNFLDVMRSAGENPATAEIDPDLDAVNIMTVHAAKGLEFKAVFLVNLVSDRFPVRERSDPIPLPDLLIKETLPVGDFHLQEERRLFYVGVTRAQDLLYLTYARDYGGKRTRKVSQFVLETLDVAQVEGMPVKSSALEKIERFKSDRGQLIFDFEKQKIFTQNRILDLSRIQIESYLSCCLQYWYGYVVKLQVPRNYNLIYGTALHKTAEVFYRSKLSGNLISLTNLLQVLSEVWVSEGFLSAEHERLTLTKAKKVITDFYKRERDKELQNIKIEENFKFAQGKVLVRGRFDYLELKGDNSTILDFKSSEGIDDKKAESRVKGSIQLKIYALAFKERYDKAPEKIGIYFLESGLVSTIPVTKEILTEAETAIKVAEAGIRARNFKANPKEGAFTCQYCSFNRICPESLV